jgi:hypothetical protein
VRRHRRPERPDAGETTGIPRGHGAGRALWLCAAALGCHAEFRFDEPVLVVADGGPDSAADPPADAPVDLAAEATVAAVDVGADVVDCFVGLCGWQRENACGVMGCQLECEGPSEMCSGTCGVACEARCRDGARCALTAAERADLECRERASCSFVAGAGSQVRCREGAVCTIRCLGACALDCEDATCRLQCAADPAPVPVSGTVRCP